MKSLKATRIGVPEEIRPGMHLLRATTGPTGELLLLYSDAPIDFRPRSADPHTFQILRSIGDGWDVFRIRDTTENFQFAQPLPGGSFLLARKWSGGDAPLNACVYAPDGAPLRWLSLGVDLNDVQATPAGHVWVAYGDEGIYKQNRPYSHDGCVAFSSDGEPVFRFGQVLGNDDLPAISDCDAMNVVSDSEVWLSYYTEYPLVRIVNGHVDRWWRNPWVQGSPAFAVDRDRILFAGSSRQPQSLVLVDLGTYLSESLTPVDSSGRELLFKKAFARGSNLFLNTETGIHRVEWP